MRFALGGGIALCIVEEFRGASKTPSLSFEQDLIREYHDTSMPYPLTRQFHGALEYE